MGKPTLQEIAKMPLPASVMAMRKHYNSEWGKPVPDDGEVAMYRVEISYSVRETCTRTYTVEAFSEQDAEQAAGALFDKDMTVEFDAEVDDIEITRLDR